MQKIEKKVGKAVFKPVLSDNNAFIENLMYLARQGGGFAARLTAAWKFWRYGWLQRSGTVYCIEHV